MTQFDFGVIDANVEDGTELAADLNQWRDALHSLHRGSTRPSYVAAGMLWIDDSGGASNWILKLYASPTAGDVPVFVINTTTGAISLSSLFTSGSMQALTILAQGTPLPSFRWNNTGNATNARAWRATVLANGNLRFSAYSDAGVEGSYFELGRDNSLVRATLPDTFHVYMSGDVGIGPGATVLVPFNTVFDNIGSRFSTGSSAFVADKAGLWQFNLHLALSIDSAPCPMGAIIRKVNAGGSPTWDYSSFVSQWTNAWPASASLSIVQQMAVGDTCSAWAVNGSGSSGGYVRARDASGAFVSTFSGARVG